jgi:hypothetical protein
MLHDSRSVVEAEDQKTGGADQGINFWYKLKCNLAEVFNSPLLIIRTRYFVTTNSSSDFRLRIVRCLQRISQ